jgi:hypothetical protein
MILTLLNIPHNMLSVRKCIIGLQIKYTFTVNILNKFVGKLIEIFMNIKVSVTRQAQSQHSSKNDYHICKNK